MSGNHNSVHLNPGYPIYPAYPVNGDQNIYPADSDIPAGTSKTLRTVSDDALATNEETSINMLKYVAWVVGDMAGRDIDIASPMTHRFINGGR